MDAWKWLFDLIGFDWIAAFRPATLTWLAGGDPYALPGGFPYLNPPWLLPFLAPLAILPPTLGAWMVNLVTVTGLVALCGRRGRLWLALPLVVSYPVMTMLYHGQVDGFVLWGLALGGPPGVLLVMTKPQVAGLVVLVWALRAWHRRGLLGVARLFLWPALVMLAFTAVYPQWLSAAGRASGQRDAGSYNWWPLLVVPGFLLLLWGLRRLRPSLAASATAMVAPYLRPWSAIGALTLVAVEYPWLGLGLVVLSWWPVALAFDRAF